MEIKSPSKDASPFAEQARLGVPGDDGVLARARRDEERAPGRRADEAPYHGEARLAVAEPREEGEADVRDRDRGRLDDAAERPGGGEVLGEGRDGERGRAEAEHRPVQRGGDARERLDRLPVPRRHGCCASPPAVGRLTSLAWWSTLATRVGVGVGVPTGPER